MGLGFKVMIFAAVMAGEWMAARIALSQIRTENRGVRAVIAASFVASLAAVGIVLFVLVSGPKPAAILTESF